MMQFIDINYLLDQTGSLGNYIPDNFTIVGKIDKLIINYKYNKLDLSNIECGEIFYYNQKGESIKNHILPNTLLKLWCYDNLLTSLPDLPNSLQSLICDDNRLLSLPHLPNSLQSLICYDNQLISLPDLPNSLEELHCNNNQLISLPDLPNSLEILDCSNNKLTSLPEPLNVSILLECQNNLFNFLPNLNKLKLMRVNCCIEYIEYEPHYNNTEINIDPHYNQNILHESYIEIKDYGKITSREEYIQYMEKIKLNKIKSAKK